MASTYSNLKFELIGSGDQSGTWGNTTNTNIGTAIEQAIVGMATLSAPDFAANVATLTLTNTNALQTARAVCLVISAGSVSAAGTVNVPAIEKPYIVINSDSFAVTIKVAGQTGVTVPAGKRTVVYNNGTDVGDQINYLSGLSLGTQLGVASGGTGADTFTLNSVLLGNGSSTFQTVAPGAAGNVLTSDGTTWSSAIPSISPASTITWTSPQTFNGGINVNTSVLYQGPTKQVVTAVTASTATTTIDLATADTFLVTIATNTSLVFANAPTGGVMKSFNMVIQNTVTPGYAVSFPGTVSWAGGVTPARTTSANARDLWSFFSLDGVNYAGSLSIKNY